MGQSSTVIALVVIGIEIIAFLATFTIALYYYSKNNNCTYNPNIWCWTDFTCPTGTNICATGCTTIECITGASGGQACWAGVTGLYAALNNTCQYTATGGTSAPACTCQPSWQNAIGDVQDYPLC